MTVSAVVTEAGKVHTQHLGRLLPHHFDIVKAGTER
jgi:hypothetical protein